MAKILENEYQGSDVLTADQIRRALSGDYDGFKYFFENCLLIQDRDTRQYIHPKMNVGQQMIAKAIFKNVDKKTRKNEHREIVVIGPRQFGKSTLFTAIGDYLPAYVPGMENLNTVHTLQTGTTAGKYFKQKIAPIVANVHPSIFPTIERDTLGTSTLLKFKDIKGIPRGGYYEVVSAGSNSVRSGTVSVWLCDEPSEYRNPEMVENNPDDIELVFIPWFLVYGREGDGLGFTEDQMTDYDKEVIIPEMRKWGVPQDEWFDKLGWYHTRALRTSKMRYEFPSSIDDIINMTSDRLVFNERSIASQNENLINGKKYRIVTDNGTGKVEAQETDVSPFTIYREPIFGHSYRIAIDPITAQSQDTDNFVMMVFDTSNHEQVAVFRDRGLQDEDYADWAVSIGTIYNKAQLCPESNVANGFVVAVNSKRYYRWFYQNKKNKADRVPGIRTTVSSKEYMVDCLGTLLDRGNIIIHDLHTIEELFSFVRHVKTRTDGSSYVRFAAKAGHHDDDIAALWIYAGSLDMHQIEGRRHSGFAII